MGAKNRQRAGDVCFQVWQTLKDPADSKNGRALLRMQSMTSNFNVGRAPMDPQMHLLLSDPVLMLLYSGTVHSGHYLETPLFR